jgi:hypothetical protein
MWPVRDKYLLLGGVLYKRGYYMPVHRLYGTYLVSTNLPIRRVDSSYIFGALTHFSGLLYHSSGLRRLSPPRGAGWEPGDALRRIRRAKRSQHRAILTTGARTSDAVAARLRESLGSMTTTRRTQVGDGWGWEDRMEG